jgi:hypothetical protein
LNYPASKKLTKVLKALFEEFKINPYNWSYIKTLINAC